MQKWPIDPETIAALSGLALAVALRYVPKIAGGWDALDRTAKTLVLAALCLSVSAVLVLAQCGTDSVCINTNAAVALRAALTAFVSSQAGYLMVRKPSGG